jgi:Uma2 family endonuclease
MGVQKVLLTADAFWNLLALPEFADRRLELIDGEMFEKMSPTLQHGRTARRIYIALSTWLVQNPIGEVVFEVDHYTPDDPHNTRRPDISFIAAGRGDALADEPVPFMPDLAVEIRSPSNRMGGGSGLREKAAYYLAHGTRMVWLVDAGAKQIEVFTPAETRTLNEADTLDGGAVLPGFALPVRVVFADPSV